MHFCLHPPMKSFDAALPHPDDTDRLGAALAQGALACREAIAADGLALRLEGNLGAGKTSLIRAMLRALGWQGPVKSPTFSLLETYRANGIAVNHFDFYRFEAPEEFDDAGFRDLYGAGALCASEWSCKAEPYLPPADLVVSLAPEGLGRRVHAEAMSASGKALLDAMEAAWTSNAAA